MAWGCSWVGGWLLSWQQAANELPGMNPIGNNGHEISRGRCGEPLTAGPRHNRSFDAGSVSPATRLAASPSRLCLCHFFRS